MSKPSLPQGTRDFSASIVRKRNYIFNTIKSVFELYGFEPLETPAMENLETLMGKYGEEGDKLIFKILNNGLDNKDKEPKIREDFDLILQGKNNKGITERALKYDLTIPFARYVAMNHTMLAMPFKRYQIQPVWRADRPQRGRYREFYQCDADVVGSNSLINEVELTNIYTTVFNRLGIDVEIKVNSRKILEGIADLCGFQDRLIDITTALDKLDKIGEDKVKKELALRGLPESSILAIFECLKISNLEITEQICLDCVGVNLNELSVEAQTVACLKDKFKEKSISSGIKGCDEILYLLKYFKENTRIKFDISLARGLNYYTGIIFEVKAKNVQMGSIGGGGRYDDLTSLFGVPNISGVGISFGVDRIYDVMEELNLFPENIAQTTTTKILFFNLGDAESQKAYELVTQLRRYEIGCELYHENAKFDKQFKYAEKKGISHVAIIGTKELEDGKVNIKNLKTSQQTVLDYQDINSIINLIS